MQLVSVIPESFVKIKQVNEKIITLEKRKKLPGRVFTDHS